MSRTASVDDLIRQLQSQDERIRRLEQGTEKVPHARLHLSTNLSLVHATITALNWSTGGNSPYNYVLNGITWNGAHHLFAPFDGVYAVGASGQYASNSLGERYMDMLSNYPGGSSPEIILSADRRNTASNGEQHIDTTVRLQSQAYVYVRYYQSSGGALNLTAGAFTNMYMVYLGS